MTPSQLERIEVLEVTVAELIPREELLNKLNATAAAAGAARDVATRLEILLEQKIVAMVEEDHRTLRGQNGTPGLVADVASVKKTVGAISRAFYWALAGLGAFLAGLLWALITHKILIEEVVTKAAGG